MVEIWGTIPGYEGLYTICNDGRVYSARTRRFVKPRLHHTGYYYIGLTDRNGVRREYRLHRLVARTFCVNDDPEHKTMVNHKNENKQDNRAENLEWCTARYNVNYGTCIDRRKAALEREVVCLNFNGDEVARYRSVAEANKALGKDPRDNQISRVCNRKARVAFGFKWKYAEDL